MRDALGELTEVITLEAKTSASDGAGGHTATWTAYATDVWAKVEPLRGAERLAASRNEATSLYLVKVRNRTDVQERHRMKWGTRYLNIKFVQFAGPRDAFLEFEAELGAGTA